MGSKAEVDGEINKDPDAATCMAARTTSSTPRNALLKKKHAKA